METVPAGDGERNRTEYRKDYQEECPQRVDDQRRRIEQEFQQFPEEILYGPFHVVHRAVHIHPAGFYSVKRTQLVQPVVKSLLVDQIGCLGIPFHRLNLQLVLLCPVLVHVKGLRLQYGMGPFHDGREDAVQRTQNECRKEHDTKPQSERTQKRKDIHRLGTCQSLPYTIRHIEKRSQTGKASCHTGHL